MFLYKHALLFLFFLKGITKREIVLGCGLMFLVLITVILYIRNRLYTVRKNEITEQQNELSHTDQATSVEENIHLYSTAEGTSASSESRNDSMQGVNNVLESDSSTSSIRDLYVDAEYIHPYDLLVYNSQDNNQDYRKLDHCGMNYSSITYDSNEEVKLDTSADINDVLSIKPGNMHFVLDNITESSPFIGKRVTKKHMMNNSESTANIHITGSNVIIKQNVIECTNCAVKLHKIDVIDDISLD